MTTCGPLVDFQPTRYIGLMQRSELMRRVRRTNTKPELIVRRMLHGLGYRFRLYDGQLPGRPDLVLRRHRTVVFVHGCFWHRHPRCKMASHPATNVEFWQAKFTANKRRDRRNQRALEQLGWRVIVVWECETRQPETLATRLRRELRKRRETAV